MPLLGYPGDDANGQTPARRVETSDGADVIQAVCGSLYQEQGCDNEHRICAFEESRLLRAAVVGQEEIPITAKDLRPE